MVCIFKHDLAVERLVKYAVASVYDVAFSVHGRLDIGVSGLYTTINLQRLIQG